MKKRIVLLSLLLVLFAGCGGPPTAEHPFGPGIDVNDVNAVGTALVSVGQGGAVAGTALGLGWLVGLSGAAAVIGGLIVGGMKKK